MYTSSLSVALNCVHIPPFKPSVDRIYASSQCAEQWPETERHPSNADCVEEEVHQPGGG